MIRTFLLRRLFSRGKSKNRRRPSTRIRRFFIATVVVFFSKEFTFRDLFRIQLTILRRKIERKIRCMVLKVDYPYFPFRLSVDYVLISRTDDAEHQFHRTLFEGEIRRLGLIVSQEIAGPICFTLISTPFHILCREAEKSEMSFSLKNCPILPQQPTCCISLSNIFIAGDHVRFVTAPFNRKYATNFLNYHNETKFMSSAQRSMLTHKILKEIDISKQFSADNPKMEETKEKESTTDMFKNDEPLRRQGLLFLLMEGAYEDSFILHEPSEEEPYYREIKDRNEVDYFEMLSQIDEDPRKDLASIWTKWFRFQPLNMIRNYFGEQIAFYFAWQGTFITLLWVASIIGIGVFVFGFVKSVHTFPFAKCVLTNSTGYMTELDAPECKLRDSFKHFFSALSNWFMKSFDNELNAFFAVFMSIWGSVFYQVWRRNNTVLVYQWDCDDYTETEPDRAEFIGTQVEIDQVTGEPEWLYPQFMRFLKIILSCSVVLLCMCIVVISVLCVTLYKLYALNHFQCGKEFTLTCSMTSSWLPSIMNTVSTMVLGVIYTRIAEWLNNWENHRTQTEHNNALIIKLFAFQFVNNYTSLFYIAVFRPENHNLQPNGLFNLGVTYKDTCAEGTCSSLLALQLLTHMIIKPFPKFFKDVVLSYLLHIYRTLTWFHRRSASLNDVLKENDETSVLVREWLKPCAQDFTLGEFNEKIILFGTTMMFAALFPLAPIIALLIGIVDLRIDATRLIWFNRRPVPVVTTGIGIWLPILTFLQYAAVTTNAFIIAFTSDFCTNVFSGILNCDFQDRLLIVIVFQNIVFVLKFLMQNIIPTAPANIRVANRRKRFVINYMSDKGDVPAEIRKKRKATRAKLAWITGPNKRRKNVVTADKEETDKQIPRTNRKPSTTIPNIE